MSYIDKIKKGSTTYDVQDARIPTGTANKVLGTNAQGEYELQSAASGGTQLYKHTIPVSSTEAEISGNICIISTLSEAATTSASNSIGFLFNTRIGAYLDMDETSDGDKAYLNYLDATTSNSNATITMGFMQEDQGALAGVAITCDEAVFSDTVTSL